MGVFSRKVVAVHIINDDSAGLENDDNNRCSEKSVNNVEAEPAKCDSGALETQQVDKKVLSVLQGNLSSYAIFKAKIVRIFISSTFTGNEFQN